MAFAKFLPSLPVFGVLVCKICVELVALKLTGKNLEVIWAKFSTLSLAVLVRSAIERYRQTGTHLKLKARPRFYLASLREPTKFEKG